MTALCSGVQWLLTQVPSALTAVPSALCEEPETKEENRCVGYEKNRPHVPGPFPAQVP